MNRPPAQRAHRATSLVSREQEQQLLTATLDRASDGQLSVVLVSGEPGIGKSRLIRDFTASVQESTTLIEATCSPAAGPPFAAMHDALRQITTTSAQWGIFLEQFELASFLSNPLEYHAATPSARNEFRTIIDRIARLVQALARERSVVVSLDDAQWASEPDLELIRFLLRSPRDTSILIILSYRDTEIDPRGSLQQLIRDAYRERQVERIALSRIGEHGARQLIGAVLDSPAHAISRPLAQAIQREAEGVPFFIEELVLHLFETGALKKDGKTWSIDHKAEIDIPQSIHAVVTSRLMSLSQPAQDTLAIAAIAGRVFRLDLLIEVARQIASTSSQDVAQYLDEALTRSLLVEHHHQNEAPGQDYYAFAHDQIRDVLVRDLNAIRRRILHQAIGEALESIGSQDDPGYNAALAHHFGNGEDIERASGYAERAGDQDADLGAFRQATIHYSAALEIHTLRRTPGDWPEREMRLLEKRQTAYGEMGEHQAQSRDIDRWQTLATELDHPEQLFRSTDALARFAISQRDLTTARSAGQLLQSLAGEDRDLLRTALLRSGEAMTGRAVGDPAPFDSPDADLSEARTLFENALSVSDDPDPLLEMEIGMIDWALVGHSSREQRGEARARISEALQAFRDRDDDRGEITALIALAYRRQLRGNEPERGTPFISFLEEIRRLRADERQLVQESDRARNQARAALAVHVHCREFGMPYRALQRGYDALNWAEAAGDPRIAFYALGGLSQTELLLGHPDQAVDLAERAMALVESGAQRVSWLHALIWLGTAAASADQTTRGIELLREGVAFDDSPVPRPMTLDAMVRLAGFLADSHTSTSYDEAMALLDQVKRSTDGQPGQIPWGVEARRIESLLYQQAGDFGDAVASASAALAHLNARHITLWKLGLDVRLQVARTMLATDRQSDALPVLEAAAQSLGKALSDIDDRHVREHAATSVSTYASIQQLARAHGIWSESRTSPARQDRPGGLSKREVEILQLVAIGKTNRTIAEELFISEKTVARHLTNIYTKIGIESRTQAAAWAYQNAIA